MSKNSTEKRINEDVPTGIPYSKNIRCKDCVFALKPINGYERYTNSYCEIYEFGILSKPNDILFNNADCIHYKKDDSV